MRHSLWILLSAMLCLGQSSAQQLPAADAVRVREFYRLAAVVQDKIWPHWSDTPAPLLLVTDGGEFLTHHPAPPKDFTKVGDDLYARPRQFPTNLLATFPAFGPPSVIVIGEPANTASKTSSQWLITVMHEHFHQLQNSKPGYFEDVNKLGLSRGDNSGMWMLNYPFPYSDTSEQFAHLRNLLLAALAESDPQKFTKAAQEYLSGRKAFFGKLSADDHKYLGFQLWYEGIARYTEVRCAEAAAEYQKLLDHRGVVINNPLGALAHLGLGRAYALAGDSAKAKIAYQDFLALWKDADSDIPILKEAKSEYAALH